MFALNPAHVPPIAEILNSGNVAAFRQRFSDDRNILSATIPGAFLAKGRTFKNLPLTHYTILIGKLEMFQLLLSLGMPVDQTWNDWTLLHMATYLNQIDFVEVLIFFKATVDCRDKLGVTPIEMAVREGFTDVVCSLLKAGANVREKPTALHLAVVCGNEDIVALLLKYGADPTAKNQRGKSAFDLVIAGEQTAVEDVLKSTKPVEPRDFMTARNELAQQPVSTLKDLLGRMPAAPQRRNWEPVRVTRL
jgi:hypothetical protein